IRYALSNPNVSGVLVGMAELDHLDQALGAQEMGPLPEEVLDAIHALVATDFGQLA
ncbi:MAG: aldo/keto reductase, partial [Chloroflexi bacterium]|nr:aldo/keto reductase [Chloroflexota bacterium]